MEKEIITCDTCDWNDDNLCEKMGFLIDSDDKACNKYKHDEKE